MCGLSARTDPPAQVKAQTGSDAKSEPRHHASTDVAKLFDMTLSDILLAAIQQDPQGAGRIFARAVVQADTPHPHMASERALSTKVTSAI
jgi:hypothetical protein